MTTDMTTERDPADAIRLPLDPARPVPATLLDARDRLSARDLAVLHDIGALHVLSARHIQRLRFTTGSPRTQARRATTTLQRLHSHGLVTRLARTIGGTAAGSASYLYRLTPQGRRLLGLPGPRGGRRRVLDQPTQLRTGHILATSEVAVQLTEARRAGRLELLRFDAEPYCWRTWTGLAGEPRQLRPDALTVVAVGEWELWWFLEIDLGTEHPDTITRKADTYRAYARSGTEQQHHDVFPRVAFLANSPQRRDALARILHPHHADAFYTVATLDDATDILATDTDEATETTEPEP